MAQLPTGTVTFLFTDLEGSTRLWEEHPDAMQGALARHDEILRDAVESHSGHVVKTTGDGVHAAFADPVRAIEAAIAGQRVLRTEATAVGTLRVRMGIHTGPAELRAGDYYGTAVNRAARLMSAAHGGQIVVSLATAELARDDLPGDVELVDLGEHQLRDLARLEHVFQVVAPGLEREFPALRSLDAFPGNLPAQLTTFVGRDPELDGIAAALTETRLVTITGAGGVGKTRLAIQVAADVLPRFADGAWLCELAAAMDGDAMRQVVVATLGIQLRAGASLDDSIVEFLRSRRLLLVLDNCEHLLRPVRELVGRVLQHCPGVRILATSLEALGIAGEQVWPLRSLDVPRSGAVGDVSACEAAVLFADRARSVRPDFLIDASNADAVADICRRLDGIPLALELAAARTVAMSPADIASRLDERFRLLASGRDASMERHHTLRGVVDWSYSLLAPVERSVFDRLAVFSGTFDARAAEAVVAGDGVEGWDVLDALTDLVAKSMVVADDRRTATTRYQMLETLRAYARERLDESGDSDAWRRRHATYCAALAEVIGPQLRGPDELAARVHLREELDNLRAAVGWALDHDDRDAELGLRIVAALALESYMDRSSEIGAWAARAAPRAQHVESGRRMAVLAAAAQEILYRGDYASGRAVAADALRNGLRANGPALHLAHMTIAECAVFGGDHRGALSALAASRQAIEDCGDDDQFSITSVCAAEATFTAMGGDFTNARPMAEAVVARARALQNPSTLTVALFALGFAHWEDDPTRALAALDESAALSRAGASDMLLAAALSLAARIRARLGDATGAVRALRDALVAADDIGDRPTFFAALDRGIEILATVPHEEGAAVIAGAVTRGPFRELTPLAGGPEEQARVVVLEEVRGRLGSPAFDAAVQRGASMSYDELRDYAVGELDRIAPETVDDAQRAASPDRHIRHVAPS